MSQIPFVLLKLSKGLQSRIIQMENPKFLKPYYYQLETIVLEQTNFPQSTEQVKSTSLRLYLIRDPPRAFS